MTFDYATTPRGAIGVRIQDVGNSPNLAVRPSFPVTSDLLNRTLGSITLFYMSYVGHTNGFHRALCDIWFDEDNRYYLYFNTTDNRFVFELFVNGEKISVAAPAPVVANQVYFISASWASNNISIISDGHREKTNKHGGFPTGDFPATVYVGNNAYSTFPINGIVWNFALLNRPVNLATWNYLEDFYRNTRLADYIVRRFRGIWYGSREGRQRYRLGN